MKKTIAAYALIWIVSALFLSCVTKKPAPMPEEDSRQTIPTAPTEARSDDVPPTLTAISATSEFTLDDLPIEGLKAAMAHSRRYLGKKSIQGAMFKYGDQTYTTTQILFSYDLFETLLDEYGDKPSFLKKFNENFLILKSPGDPTTGDVLFTGYYEPVVEGARKKDAVYHVPAFSLPSDLKTLNLGSFRPDLAGRTIKYRNVGGAIVPYYSRRKITGSGVLEGKSKVLMWFRDPVDLFFMQIQGSGIVRTPNNTLVRLGYAGANGRPYTSIGRYLIKENIMTRDAVSMQNIKKYLSENPSEIDKVLNINESYTFFTEQNIAEGPYGNINVPLTPQRSIATDTQLFPKAALGFVSTKIPNCTDAGVCDGFKNIYRFVVNQDTGGAIKGFHRADIFWGRGKYADAVAGRMKYRGNLYIFVAKKHLLQNIS